VQENVMMNGSTRPGFEKVRDAFSDNFAKGLETGAAFAVYRNGEMLVDLWGGFADADRQKPWQKESLQLIYSGSKGLTAIAILMLIDRGLIDVDSPVSRYWPAFGKPQILVRHILSHTSRLPGIEEPTSWADFLDDAAMARKLERQQPFEDDRAAFTYHPMTYGWLCGELLRQVDGRSLGQLFAEEIAGPLKLDIWFGLPEKEEARVTKICGDGVWGHVSPNLILPTEAQKNDDPLRTAIWHNPSLFGPDFSIWNSRALHAVEVPGAGAIGTARSIAKLYSLVASNGGGLIRPETLQLGTQTFADGMDILNETRRRFGAGFNLQTETMQFGPNEWGFGHGGAGGSVHGGWPDLGIGFSYAMNRLIDGEDVRASRLLEVLDVALDQR
jgi:CubicO group peptidase (beta-lactamase class C family)